MLCPQNLRDPVVKIVVCEDGAEQLLLCLNGMGHAKRGHITCRGLQIRNLIHIRLLKSSRLLQVRMFGHVEQIGAQPVDKRHYRQALGRISRLFARYSGALVPIYFASHENGRGA